MDSKSTAASGADFIDKVRDVTESLKEEFNLTSNPSENDYINTGPPPNMKRRKLIFDSMRTIIENDAGNGTGGGSGAGDANEDKGRYVYVFGAGYHGQLGRKAARGHKKYANIPIGVHLSANIAVREISCGALHTAVVTDDGLIYSWGDGRMGQLGHLQEGFSNQPVATLVSSLSGVSVSHISCGQNHTICVTSSGKVYSWGWAKYGQLGLGTRTNQRYPVQIADEAFGGKSIKQVSCGDRHSVAISSNGEIFTFGSGEHGQLGHDNNNDQYTPQQIESLQYTKIKHSSCGSIHTAIVSDDGKLFIFGFGENLYGKQGGNFNYSPVLIPLRHNQSIKSVACGQSHILILCTNGDVYAWGDGSYGEIGQGAFKASQQPRLVLLNKNIASIACGRYHSAAVTNNGSLYTWGCGDNGQLGRPQNSNNDNTMINIKKATSIPKLVVSLLGNVVGEISCGEHHTCVLASCRYKNLSEDTFEYGKLEEIEFQSKLNLISSSKQKGRGIAKKDLIRIKKWRKEEEQRIVKKKQYNQISENKKIEHELNKIASRKDIVLNSANAKSMTSSPAAAAIIKENREDGKKYIKSRTSKKEENESIVMNEDKVTILSQTSFDGDENRKRVSAKVANQNRASFHEASRNFLYGVAAQIFGGESEAAAAVLNEEKFGKTAEQRIKNKFSFRKEYDKLKLMTHRKDLELQKLDEDLAILQEVDDCSEIASHAAEMQLRKLGMKLNTVMIKISEAERSKRTYELNIVHIKDESQENHKQLDSLRRNLFLQQNLKKKIAKFKEYAHKQKDFAVCGLKEFNAELTDWRKFLEYQYNHLQSLANKNENSHNIENVDNVNIKCDVKCDKKAKKQQKAMNRMNKLKKLVETNENEMKKLSEKLVGFEDEINFFEERFKRIYSATGLSDTDKIINKFFVNREIQNEQNGLLEELYDGLKSAEEESVAVENELKLLHNSRNDHTWREIDMLQEQLCKKESDLQQEKMTQDKIHLEFTLLQEWMNVIINNLLKHLRNYQIDDELIEIKKRYSAAPSSRELVDILFQYIQILINITNDIESYKEKEVEEISQNTAPNDNQNANQNGCNGSVLKSRNVKKKNKRGKFVK